MHLSSINCMSFSLDFFFSFPVKPKVAVLSTGKVSEGMLTFLLFAFQEGDMESLHPYFWRTQLKH